MKMSNKEKDYLSIIVAAIIFGAFIWLLTGAVLYISSLFAEETKLTDIEKANKFYAEEQIKTEMRWLALKDYVDNMSEEEFIECFYKDEIESL